MSYKKSDFGKGLLDQLKKGYDPDRISKWALKVRLDHMHEMEDGVYEPMMDLISMEGDPQFYITENELRRLAARLMES